MINLAMFDYNKHLTISCELLAKMFLVFHTLYFILFILYILFNKLQNTRNTEKNSHVVLGTVR